MKKEKSVTFRCIGKVFFATAILATFARADETGYKPNGIWAPEHRELVQSLHALERRLLDTQFPGSIVQWNYARLSAPPGYATVLTKIMTNPNVRKILVKYGASIQSEVARTVAQLETQTMRLFPVPAGVEPTADDWITQQYLRILESGFFPMTANTAAGARLYGQMGEPNAFTFTSSPSRPMVAVISGLVGLMKSNPDAIASVLSHELGHNLGYHIWAQIIWTALSDEFGQYIIGNQDSQANDVFSGLPEAARSELTKFGITEEQKAALNAIFSGMQPGDLRAKLNERIDSIIGMIRDDSWSGRTGRYANTNRNDLAERELRRGLKEVIRNLGKNLRAGFENEREFTLFFSDLASTMLNADGPQQKNDKKDVAAIQRQQELHADRFGLILMTILYEGDVERAIRANGAADAMLAGGANATYETIRAQAKEIMAAARADASLENDIHDGVYAGMASHPASVVRALNYEFYARSASFRVSTNPLTRFLWTYLVLLRARDAEYAAFVRTGESMNISQHALGLEMVNEALADYSDALYRALTQDVDKLFSATLTNVEKTFETSLTKEFLNGLSDILKIAEEGYLVSIFDGGFLYRAGGYGELMARLYRYVSAKEIKDFGELGNKLNALKAGIVRSIGIVGVQTEPPISQASMGDQLLNQISKTNLQLADVNGIGERNKVVGSQVGLLDCDGAITATKEFSGIVPR